jgi:hypothetical protein
MARSSSGSAWSSSASVSLLPPSADRQPGGWAASILLGNAPRTDILAQHAEKGTTIGVQSKAANGGGDFQVGVKGEIPSKPGQAEWFIFVGLGSSDTRPEFFIVPRNVIAAFAWCSHRAWIKGTSRDGKPHKDNSMRNI